MTAMYAYMIWDETYSVGIASIDAQHQRILKLVNRVMEAMEDGRTGQVIGDVLQQLNDYALTHFTHEEDMLARHRYPDQAAQQTEHAHFSRTALGFHRDLQEKSETLNLRVADFLTVWWKHHILEVDMRYGDYFAKQGIQEP
jgi:hemerythrin-like metal-binding protein